MEIQGKVWGITSKLFSKNNVEIHRIVGEKHGYCSKHKHVNKYNMFYVEHGALQIETWKDYGLVDKTILFSGQSCVVEPGQYHRFKVIEDVVAFEIYWVELDGNDIVRADHGGKKAK